MSRPPQLQMSASLSALQECGFVDGMRIWQRLIIGSIVIVIVSAIIMPWTQTSSGDGRVIAYSPVDRETPIKAPIDGRISKWHVVEGQWVDEGELLAELEDNDPQILGRLAQARDAIDAQALAIESAVTVAGDQVAALKDARDAAVESARFKVQEGENKLSEAKQKLIAARAKRKTAAINLKRQRSLNKEGLSSDRELELAELSAATAKSEQEQALASVRAAKNMVSGATANLSEVRNKQRASIEKARGDLEKLRAEAQKAKVSTAEAATKLSRQERMTIRASRAGRVLSVQARAGSDFVKAGQTLAFLVPENAERAVEIWIDGNDAPLVHPGHKVRLQFEGWPAVQFVGWPSVAVGTFGGEVSFVDPAAGANGKFRVVVKPDLQDAPWPELQYLRQGLRARAWVLLNRVTVAFEIWRQLNGFPATTPSPN